MDITVRETIQTDTAIIIRAIMLAVMDTVIRMVTVIITATRTDTAQISPSMAMEETDIVPVPVI